MDTTFTRRRFAGLATAAVAVPAFLPSSAAASVRPTTVVKWIDEHAQPLRSTSANGPLNDLSPLRNMVANAQVVGLGESAHGTSTELAVKHRLIRYLVERMGFRTVSWEESWGSGVVIDRYVVDGVGTARGVVGDALFMLQTEAMLELVEWMREFNRNRPRRDRVRFLGSDVLELRPVLFDEIVSHVSDVAPRKLPDLRRHLDRIKLRGTPSEHFGWYLSDQLTEEQRRELVGEARAVYDLVRGLPGGRSEVEQSDAVQHAFTILGWYDSNTETGNQNDLRDVYIDKTLARWQRRTGHRIIYSAANAHTAACDRQLISFPPDTPVMRSLAGGHLRRRYGRRYVSIGMVFNHGQVLTGWELGGPSVYTLPAPDPSFVDRVLGQAQLPNYLLDLHSPAPSEVRRWLNGPARMRILSSAYYPDNDTAYAQGVDHWRDSFDAILHLRQVTPSRLLAPVRTTT